ncbi:hypothetical protein MmiEs2_02000 [Methanimicrococcus stummii]|uniref:GLUG domain-containing protein n=1 Tax=Methanimicrococcus stummii TaxID=3028294 RepID=A0AA96V9A6_9EURY|nr:GLUG motif-containing protein [Methanimicrococcus sp. Es2]WNY28020.1 hypothetical protein MmiEs2_02000 [Methanimicrococcus sp. Es2]
MKYQSILFVLLFLLCSLSVSDALSVVDPRFSETIESETDLLKIGAEWPLDGVYYLESDIVISDSTWRCIGYSNSPFTGEFEGNGHAIIFTKDVLFGQPFGPTIDAGSQGYGFFGNIRGDAEIRNLTIVYNGDILNQNDSNVGAFVGIASNGTNAFHYKITGLVENAVPKIVNCSVMGNEAAVFGNSNVGGFAGLIRNCDISDSSSDISATAKNENAGGFIGYIYRGNITNCSATGLSYSPVDENLFIGGFNENYGSNIVDCSYNPVFEPPSEIGCYYPKYPIWIPILILIIAAIAVGWYLFDRKKKSQK